VPEWRPALELLKHHPNYREQWHEHRELDVRHCGSISVEHRLATDLSDEELEAAFAAIEHQQLP
jgi:hypothetical protein